MDELQTLESDDLRAAVEAMLLVATDPVKPAELAAILGVTAPEVSLTFEELSQEYTRANRGMQLREVAGGWRLYTHPAWHDQVEDFVLSWDTRKLSQSALETLAVIAYLQPVTREGVRSVRGVSSDGVISSLIDKGLVREMGRDKEHGRAILYGTTNAFLERFGLKSPAELPNLEDFAPDEESKRFIRERLSGASIESTLEDAAGELDEDRELFGVGADLEAPNEEWSIAEGEGRAVAAGAPEDEA